MVDRRLLNHGRKFQLYPKSSGDLLSSIKEEYLQLFEKTLRLLTLLFVARFCLYTSKAKVTNNRTEYKSKYENPTIFC